MIEIYDCTLREGMQAEGMSITVSDKLKVMRCLDETGVSYIEAGSPASNPKDIELFELIPNLKLKNAVPVAFGATRRKNTACGDDAFVAALLNAGTQTVAVYGKAWDMQVEKVLKTSPRENLAMVAETVEYLSAAGRHVFFDAEHFFDGYAASPDFALSVIKAAYEAGAERIILCDTNGGALPDAVAAAVEAAASVVPVEAIGIHCHNDGGLAVASSLAAVNRGVRHVQGTFGGVGERCGNADLCTLIPDIELKNKLRCLPDGKIGTLTLSAARIAGALDMKIPPRNPYVGRSAFAHKGGTHIDGVLKCSEAFEHIKPETVGNNRRLLMSELSGRAAVRQLLARIMPDYSPDPDKLDSLVAELKRLEAEGYQFEVAEESFELRVKKLLGLRKKPFEVDYFKIIGEKTGSGEEYTSTAMLSLRVGSKRKITAAEGRGPVNALDNALRQALTAFYPCIAGVSLRDYKVRVIDDKDSTAAKVRVIIESTDGVSSWSTVGVSADIIEASFIALSDALEFKLAGIEAVDTD